MDRRLLVRMLEAAARRAPRRGRPEKMVRLSACRGRVFVEANGKAISARGQVSSAGACLLVHKTVLRLLRGYARHSTKVTFAADASVFRINNGNWPVAAFSHRVFPPAKYEEMS